MRDTWFKCDPQDFIDGFESLSTAAECAVYATLIFRMYASGGPVANNPAAIAAVCHVPGHHVSRIIRKLVEQEKLVETRDGRLFNRRVDEELHRRARLSDTRASAGKTGGRPKAKGPKAEAEQRGSDTGAEPEQRRSGAVAAPERARSGVLEKPEMAENSQPQKANASYARAKEKDIREERTPSPPLGRTPAELKTGRRSLLPDRIPDDVRSSDRDGSNVHKLVDHDHPPDVDVLELQCHIMREARMVAPPIDLALLDGWIRLGISPDLIRKTVTRMAASAKAPIRQFRYFDGEIRRVFEAEEAATRSNIAEFERIARRYASSPTPQ